MSRLFASHFWTHSLAPRLGRLLALLAATPSEQTQTAQDFRVGWALVAPTLPAIVIWGLVTAVAMVGAGLSAFYVLLINVVVFAGAAQLAVLTMMTLHAPMWMIWLTAAAVNLRFVIFSAALKPLFRGLPLAQRLLYGFMNGDVPLIVYLKHFEGRTESTADAHQRSVYVAMNLANMLAWHVGILIGLAIASVVSTEWGFTLAASLTLLVLVVKMVTHWAAVAGCVVAAAVAVLAYDLPLRLWVVLALVLGVAVAMLFESRWPQAWLIPPAPQGDSAIAVNSSATASSAGEEGA